jgi:predicted Zn-dependent protease
LKIGFPTRRAEPSVNDAISRLNIRVEPNSIPLTYTREEERQADVLATQIMYDTGFDAQQMTRMLQTIANDRSNRTSDLTTSHPYLSNHAAVVRTELRNIGACTAKCAWGLSGFPFRERPLTGIE